MRCRRLAGLDIRISLHQTQPRPEQEILTRDSQPKPKTSTTVNNTQAIRPRLTTNSLRETR